MNAWPRITRNPAQMGGLPCIRGLRIPVRTIVLMREADMTNQEILEELPDLEEEDIAEALAYAESEGEAGRDEHGQPRDLTREEEEELAEARESIERGEGIPWEEVRETLLKRREPK
jgi:uncharacterized protein (DUF433 family)